MWKQLVLKELREVAPLGGLALAVYACAVAQLTGFELVFWPVRRQYGIPFVEDEFAFEVSCVSVCLAIALGMRQTVGESVRGTWVWLLHRPACRHRLIAVKLITGAVVYLICAASPIIVYACWAAIPGTHASPFDWSMTFDAWQQWICVVALYFASFLCGIWPARWFGAKLLPLAGAAGLVLSGWILFCVVLELPRLAWVMPALLIPFLLVNIFAVNQSRDFS